MMKFLPLTVMYFRISTNVGSAIYIWKGRDIKRTMNHCLQLLLRGIRFMILFYLSESLRWILNESQCPLPRSNHHYFRRAVPLYRRPKYYRCVA